MNQVSKPVNQVTVPVLLIAEWGKVPAGTRIDVLRIEPRHGQLDFWAYGGKLGKTFPDMTTFDAYLLCVNPADRQRVAELVDHFFTR